MTVGRWGPLLAGVLIAGASLPASARADILPVAIAGTVDPQNDSLAIRLTVANRANAPSSATTAEIYLSTDGLVDDQDVRLTVQSIPPLGAHSERALTASAALPNMAPGRYYLLVRVLETQGGEASSHDLWGAPLFLGPDLKPGQPVGTLETGTLRVDLSATNVGTAAAGPTRIVVSLVRDADPVPVPFLSLDVAALAQGQSRAVEGTAPLPDLPPGRYHLTAQVNPDRTVAEADEINNAVQGDQEIALGPDLAIVALSATVSDNAVVATDTVVNQGTHSATPCGIAFFLSRNGVLDADDLSIGYRVLPGLTPGEHNHGTTRLPLPRKLPPGRYYLLGKVDASNAVAESDETNNLVLAPTPLDVRAGR